MDKDFLHDPEKQKLLQAILIGLIGWTCFSLSDTSVKFLSIHHSISWILVINGAFGAALAIILLLSRYGRAGFHTKKWKLHILRGVTVCLISVCVVNALARLPMADFYSIIFISPLLTALASILFMKEEFKLYRIGAIITGFVGVVIVAGPQMSNFTIGIPLTFAAALCLSLNSLIARKIGHQDALPLYALLPFSFVCLANLPFALQTGLPEITISSWSFLLAAPLIMIGQICFCQAFSRTPSASALAPFHYIQMLWGILIGYFLFKDIPSATTLIGAAIIIGSGLYLITRERRKRRFIKTAR